MSGERVLLPGTRRLPAAIAPDLRKPAHRIDVELRTPLDRAEGVLLAWGDGQAGCALHVAGDRLVHTYHHAGATTVTTSGRLDPATAVLTARLRAPEDGAGASVELLADEVHVGAGRIERRSRARLAYAGLDIGIDRGPGVGDYGSPFAFTGSIRRVIVTTDPNGDVDSAGAMAVELATG